MARMNTLWTLVLVAAGVFHGTLAYSMFSDRLPNGNFIPHPCMPNFIWKGVGHEAVLGGGRRNPFGVDFAENGFKWDSCICEQDSDGDGLTNGEEMGDPDCSWVPGEAPKHKFGLSHPGVCEPMDSAECRARKTFAIDCDALPEFTCDAINNADVRNITLSFPETSVPTEETTYFCMTFEIDADEDYHMIAYEPIISNVDVMHHLLIFGCKDTIEDPLQRIPTPAECGMAPSQCRDAIGVWTLGMVGSCLPREYGFAIGRHGYTTVMIEMHWTNPTGRTDYVDSSGIKIYYTSNLRDNTAGIMSTGQLYLRIPPGRSFVPQDGDCPSECTSRLPHPVHIAEVLFHMHYLGHSGYTELWRDGVKVTDVVKTNDYDYDRPDIVIKSPTVELRPGDYLKTRCNYNSLNRNKITFYGEGSFDEMCLSFITYYPALPTVGWNCIPFSTLDFCSLPSNQTDNDNIHINATSDLERCSSFYSEEATLADLVKYCDSTGSKCLPGCKQRIEAVRASPCFHGFDWILVETNLIRSMPSLVYLRYVLHSCDDYDFPEDDEDDNRTENESGGSSRYDPDVNGLPSGGVCPWGGGDQRSDGMAAVTERAPAAALVTLSMMLLAAQYML